MGQEAISSTRKPIPPFLKIIDRTIAAFFTVFSAIKNEIVSGFVQDRARFELWTPVILGTGAYFYFSLFDEPSALAAPVVSFFCLVGAFYTGRWRPILMMLAIFAAGFALADFRTARVDAPKIERDMRPQDVVGRLISVDETIKGRRLVIDVTALEKVDAGASPGRVRVTWRGKGFDVSPGDIIRIRAALSPPPAPVTPGGYDFGRQLFFDGIGAVGYAVTPPLAIDHGPKSFAWKLQSIVEQMRLGLFRRIVKAAPGEGGAVVAAMITGKRGAIGKDSQSSLRDSGLAHLLAISGLHMGLATGLVFFGVRALLASIEWIALRYPIKKWAAAAALCSGFAYLLLSGGGWSARRAFIMTAIIFIAIILDRKALSLRNVAVAATLILVLWPEAVLHPGFQMSFAAVAALIAAYEWASKRQASDYDYSIVGKLKKYAIGVGATDLIAATATAPFSLYHFNRAAVYSLPANLVAMPLMAFWIMPAAVLGIFLMPTGLDRFAWQFSALGVELILDSGGWVSAQEGAVVTLAQWSPMVLGVLTIGGLWFCAMSARWRWVGLAVLPISIVMAASAGHPEVFIDRTGRNIGMYIQNESIDAFGVLHPRRDKFAASAWKDHIGLRREAYNTEALADFGLCDERGCSFEVKGTKIAISKYALGLGDDCRHADLVIATYPVSFNHRKNCNSTIIDMRSAWNNGAHSIDVLGDGNFRIRSVAQSRGGRPWAG